MIEGATMAQMTTWESCYDQGWQGLIVPEAFAHPAKMARGLVSRIFDYLNLPRGSLVVDPFGGIGTTGIEGASRGLRVVCCELEPRFVALAEQNFALHRRTWEAAGDPLPRIVQGDSRGLCDVLGAALAEAVIGSPPFSESGSQPPAIKGTGADNCRKNWRADRADGYGDSPGQLGAMPAGAVDAVLSSPPYAETALQQGADYWQKKFAKNPEIAAEMIRRGAGKPGNNCTGGPDAYGVTDGQLAALPAGSVADAVVSSPPWENQEPSHAQGSKFEEQHRKLHPTKLAKDRDGMFQHEYGDTPGNIGNVTGQTFWQAARLIVIQCRTILKPGGVAVWVCKDFVRNKTRVPFSDDWRRLCEACGFRTVEWIKASLVKETVEPQLFGGPTTRRRERKSFFRRLAEKKGSPRIDWEDVLIMERVGD